MTQERRGGNPGAQISGEPIEGQCTEIRSDMGSYSIVPEWVLDRASPRAVKLYAILGRYADDSTSESWPKRRTLWKRLGCSERTLDETVKELEAIEALVKTPRFEDGVQQSNLWRLNFAPPGAADCPTPGAKSAPTPGQESRHRTRTTEREPLNEKHRADFDAVWVVYPRKHAKREALRAYAARRKEGIPSEDLALAAKHYATECSTLEREPQFVMLGRTFFGPNERWRDYLEPPAVPNAQERALGWDPSELRP